MDDFAIIICFLKVIPLLRENKGLRIVGNCILLTALYF